MYFIQREFRFQDKKIAVAHEMLKKENSSARMSITQRGYLVKESRINK